MAGWVGQAGASAPAGGEGGSAGRATWKAAVVTTDHKPNDPEERAALLAVVRTTIKKDLSTSMNSSVLLVKQLFEQAEKSNVNLMTDLPSTEDRWDARARPRSPHAARL